MVFKLTTTLLAVVCCVKACSNLDKETFLDDLVDKMTIPELVMQLHLMFADNVVGPRSDNELYGVIIMFTIYSLLLIPQQILLCNQHPQLVLVLSTTGIPPIRLTITRFRSSIATRVASESLLCSWANASHGVGSFKQSMFPQAIGLGASFDREMVYKVGRAIGEEARAIGIHACLAPVLDLGKEPRWGRVQGTLCGQIPCIYRTDRRLIEAWGEDFVLTSHMGVAFASGLSKNGSWGDPDAVVPVMKV